MRAARLYNPSPRRKEAAPRSGLSLGRKRPRRACDDESSCCQTIGRQAKCSLRKSWRSEFCIVVLFLHHSRGFCRFFIERSRRRNRIGRRRGERYGRGFHDHGAGLGARETVAVVRDVVVEPVRISRGDKTKDVA